MIMHIATFAWKPGTTPEQIDAVTAALHALPAQIGVIRSYAAGPNERVRPGGKDYGVAALLDDEAAVHTYLDHPAHLAAVEQFMAPIIAERAAVQLRVSQGSFA